VGGLVRAVVAAGGRVVAAGSERLVAHPEAARDACAERARPTLDALLDRHADTPARATRVGRFARARSFSETTRAWGGLPVVEVVGYGERATHDEGLAVVDAPSRFAEATTALAAAGASLVVHVTGDGVVAGHPVVPVLKVTGDPGTAAALPDDVDVDATDASADDLLDAVLDAADGTETRAEAHGLTQFAVTRIGPSM
jgi:altronate dehydratase large subunit